jgi:hypothetical protein
MLQILPWTRMAGAEDIKLPFKVRLCIEGIPRHARQEASVRQLLPQGMLFERFDDRHRNDGDASCCCVLIWSSDPDQIAKEGSLLVEELHDRPQATSHFADPAAAVLQRSRTGHVRSLAYEVLLHVDFILNFRPSTDSAADWPVRHSFRWRLGLRDDWRLGAPRRNVRDRLGPRKHDRSPPGDADGAGSGNTGAVTRRASRWVPQRHGSPAAGPQQQHGQAADNQ